MMRKFGAIALVTVAFAATASLPRAEAQPTQNDTGCRRVESGIIRSDRRLEGPFLVRMLQADVDPANPQRAYVIWTRENTWISVNDFHGPLYLAAGESLQARADWTPRGAVYSGCRL